MKIVELVTSGAVGGLIGVLLGITIQSYFRPISARIEQVSRGQWVDPLIVHIERDPSIIWRDAPDWVSFAMYINDPLRLPKSLPSERSSWIKWAKTHRAVDAWTTPLEVTPQARSEAAIVVDGIKLDRVRSVDLESGILLIRATGGADLEPRRFEVHLDKELVDVDWVESSGESIARPPSLVLAAGDVERFQIWATTDFSGTARPVWHEWRIELLLLVEGKRRSMIIDNYGVPFVTVSAGNLPTRTNIAGSDVWTDDTDGYC